MPATPAETIDVTVRYFASARAAAGSESESVSLAHGATVADLVEILRTRGPDLARVLDRSSFLCDEVAVRDVRKRLETHQTVDVLPPFAGG